MSLTDFAACDVDAMNARQITDFAESVGRAAIAQIEQNDGPTAYGQLVAHLAAESRLGVSEVAFGISVASTSLGLLTIEASSRGRTVRRGARAAHVR